MRHTLRCMMRCSGASVGATAGRVAAIQWRVEVFEPILARIAEALGPDADPVQGYVDFLHYRFLLSAAQGRDVPTVEAFELWLDSGKPGFALDGEAPAV